MATTICAMVFPIIVSCFLYVSMICIKKRKFSNKIDPATKTLEANTDTTIPGCSNQNQNEVLNLKKSVNPEVKDKDRKFQTNFQTSSSDTSLKDFVQDPTNDMDEHEVINIL